MDNSILDKLFTDYQSEVQRDTELNEMELKDRVMAVPTIKHKWVGRLMVHKDQLRKLKSNKKAKIKKFNNDSPISISKNAMESLVSNTPELATLDESIEKLEIIIEYLEKVEKLIGQMTFDCKNIIDIQKLETT